MLETINKMVWGRFSAVFTFGDGSNAQLEI